MYNSNLILLANGIANWWPFISE